MRGRGAPPLRALDRRGLVSYLGTFSKTLFPAARVGWLFTPPAVTAAALLAKRTMDLTTSSLLQAGLALFLREGSYDRHLRRVVKELDARLACAERALAKHLPEGSSFSRSEGGFLLWVTLPEAIDSAALLADAKAAGVVYAPGELFYPDGRRSSSLRISVAQTRDGRDRARRAPARRGRARGAAARREAGAPAGGGPCLTRRGCATRSSTCSRRRRYAGNPLAVFRGGAGLETATLQAIAREMNLSETTFVLHDAARDGAFDVRIFTPGKELPYAGHPTLGTAFVIREALLGGAAERAGAAARCRAGARALRGRRAGLADDAARDASARRPSPSAVAAALGLPLDALARAASARGRDHRPPPAARAAARPGGAARVPDRVRRVRAPARSRRTGQPLRVRARRARSAQPASRCACSRPHAGVPEDPATGSAAGWLGAYLARHRVLGAGDFDARIEQGHEIARPSLLHVRARGAGDGARGLRRRTRDPGRARGARWREHRRSAPTRERSTSTRSTRSSRAPTGRRACRASASRSRSRARSASALFDGERADRLRARDHRSRHVRLPVRRVRARGAPRPRARQAPGRGGARAPGPARAAPPAA